MKIYCTGKIGDSGHINRKLEGSVKISIYEVLNWWAWWLRRLGLGVLMGRGGHLIHNAN